MMWFTLNQGKGIQKLDMGFKPEEWAKAKKPHNGYCAGKSNGANYDGYYKKG